MRLKKTGILSLLVMALLVPAIPGAFAQSPPAVQTLKPTKMYVDFKGPYMPAPSVRDVRATLNGTVNPNGGDCTVYFEYGTTTAYGSEAAATPGAVSGASAVNVSASLTGLQENTLYHCRLVAVSDSGVYYGHDLAFIPSCDSYEIFYLNPGHCRYDDWLYRFRTSSYPTGNIEIVATPSDNPTWACFDITNHNIVYMSVDYLAGGSHSGTVGLGPLLTEQIYVPKNSIAAFYYDYSLFKQLVTNDQLCSETPLPKHQIELYSLGYLGDRQGAVYSINNRNAQAVSLDLLVGTESYSVSVPANGVVYFIAPSYNAIEASYNGEPFVCVNPSKAKWHGAALVTASPLGFDDTTATFELQNNDSAAHEVKLKNAGGLTHAYTLAPYEHQTITIEKSDWDVYLQMSNLPQPNISGLVEDGYLKINSVSPGTAPVCELKVSGSAISMGAYGGSVAPVFVTGGGAWTAVSDQPWLTVSPASGSSGSRLTFTAQANPASSFRSATVTVSDGSTTKTVTVTQTGQGRGNALSFDGVNDTVSIPDNDAAIADAFTLEAWVKWEPDSPADIQFICGKSSEQMELHTGGSANNIRFIPTTGVYLDAEGVLPTGVWTHVAAVYQPSISLAKLYINGDEVALTNNGAQPITSALGASTTAFYLGSRSDGTYHFKGSMDDFRIWNRALAQNEIRLNMVNPVVPAEQTGLVSAYSFNQGVAGGDNAGITSLTDETGYRSGSLSGFALSGASSNWVASGAGEGLVSYTVTYDSNGATSGTAPADTLKYVSGAQAVVKGAADLAKTGCTFSNWNTQANGSGTAYTAGAALNMETSNIILYAQWTPNQSITTGTISGTVTNGSIPVEGATVSLTVSGSVYSATTIADGSYSILNVPAGTGYTVTAGKDGYSNGSATGVSVTANTTTEHVDITLSCLVTYRGAQMRTNADGTYDIRFLATIDTLDANSVGFVFSKSEQNPTKENVPSTQVKSTTTVYNSVTAAGSAVTAASLGGTYIIACTVTGIPAGDSSTPLYVRAFAAKGTETTYTAVHTVTVDGLK